MMIVLHTQRSAWMQGLPENGASHTVYLYGFVLIVFGLLKSWVSITAIRLAVLSDMRASGGVQLLCGLTLFVSLQAGPCCNNPIFAEIVPANMRNMVYAFDRHAFPADS